jgi:hypothetical protein
VLVTGLPANEAITAFAVVAVVDLLFTIDSRTMDSAP